MITQEYLKSIMSYNQETGEFTWIKTPRVDLLGGKVGSKMGCGYLSTRVLRKSYLMHRLAWFYIYGCFPKQIDHKNGNRADNRLCNLREATPNQNTMNHPLKSNNTSGFKGVSWHSVMGKWLAYITVDKKKIRLGYFDDINEANKTVCQAREKLHKEFANHGEYKNE